MMRDDLRGLEYDWLAVDGDCHVALFSTAGGGFAPDPLVSEPDAFAAAIAMTLGLPVTSEVSCDLELRPELENTWKLMAERGLFAFDSDPNGGPYKLIAAPRTPVLISMLPPAIRTIAARIVLPRVRFRGAVELTESQLR